MNHRIPPLALSVSLGIVLSLGHAADKNPLAKKTPADLFGPDKVWSVHLEISAKDWEAMHPSKGPRFFGAGPAPRERDKDKPPAQPRGGFGYDFDYVKAKLVFGGTAIEDVGLRFKGNSSYMVSAQSLKRPFKLDFDRYDETGALHGLKMVNLSNNAMDPTQLRESLAFAVFRAAGIPAPRTAFVEVTLTVAGKHDKEYLGLYTLIEQVNSTFLKDHFKDGKGLLLKPEGIQGLPYLGPDWKPYADRYRPKSETDDRAHQRLIEFTRLINFADDADFNKAIGGFLDVDRFLRYLAACSAMVDLDSFVGIGHNYYLYLNPRDDRFVFLPWDLNHTFGGLTMVGPGEQQMEWAVKKPYLGGNRLAERVLAIEDNDAAYRKHLRDLMARGFKPETLHASIDRMEKAVEKVVAKEAEAKKAGSSSGLGLLGFLFAGTPPDLRKFVSRRAESVLAQLDGKSEGKAIGGGGFGGRGRGAGLGNQAAKPILETADADLDGKLSAAEADAMLRRLFQECDRDLKGIIDEKALAEGITRLMPRRSTGFGGRAPAGPGTGINLAGFAFVRAGATNNQLTLDAFLAVGSKLFRDADRAKVGMLDDKALIDGLNALPAASVPGPPAAVRPPDAPKSN